MGRWANEGLNVLIVYHFLFQKGIRQLERTNTAVCECPGQSKSLGGQNIRDGNPGHRMALCPRKGGGLVCDQGASGRPPPQRDRRKGTSGKELLPVFTLKVICQLPASLIFLFPFKTSAYFWQLQFPSPNKVCVSGRGRWGC